MPAWVVVGPGDDAAVVTPERGALSVLTTDVQVEGVHFDRRFVPPAAIGHRALAVNLSDVAAMGATPRAALLSLVMPGTLEVDVIDGILDGVLALAARHRVALVGGNISRTPGPLVIDMTLTGSVHPRRILSRAGARPGDDVYVTGMMGDALAGLQALQADPASATLELEPCRERYLRPEPRMRAGVLLGRNRAAAACMDLSDGLADGLRQIADASGVGMTIEAETLPISDGARAWHEAHGRDPVMASIAGGDDYELLFTTRATQRGRLRGVLKHLGSLPITRIGVVTKGRDLVIRTAAGDREVPSGFEHFK